MSCIFPRANGIYYWVARVDGRQVWRSLKTKDLECAKLRQAERDADQERKQKPTVRGFAERCAELLVGQQSPRTLEVLKYSVESFVRLVGDMRIDQLTPYHVDRFKALRLREVSATSTNVQLRSLKAAFNRAVRWGWLSQNPFKSAGLLRSDSSQQPYMTEPELSRLLEMMERSPLREMIEFTFYTMARLGEVAHLEWSDVDLEKGLVFIRDHGEHHVKGGRSRTVPLHSRVVMMLKQKAKLSVRVFVKLNGFPYERSSISKGFKKAIRAAGLDPLLHFHSLRHSGVTFWIQRGVPRDLVRRWAGHSTMLMTEHYTHYDTEHFRNAMRQFELAGSVVMN